jgi:tetratricopeptide (TPR) repeat protein
LSGITLLVHLGLLALFWRANRQGWFEMPAFRSAAEEDEFRKLREQAAQNPDNERLQLRTIEALRQRGSTKEAKEQLHAFLRDHPRSAEGHLILAFLESQNKRQLPTNARRHVEQALRLGLSGSENVAAANALLGQYYLNVERLDEAVRYLDAAVAAAQAPGGNLNLAHLHYLRALVQRRQRRYDAALQDIEEAIRLAQARNQEQAAAQYQREKELIIHHGGSRPLP